MKKWLDANTKYNARFAYLWSVFAFGLALLQPKDWEFVALTASVIALAHLYVISE